MNSQKIPWLRVNWIWCPCEGQQRVPHVDEGGETFVVTGRPATRRLFGRHVAVWLIWLGSRINWVSTLISGSSLHTAAGRLRRLAVPVMTTLLTKAISVTHSPNAHLSCCESNERVGSFMKCLCFIMILGVSHGHHRVGGQQSAHSHWILVFSRLDLCLWANWSENDWEHFMLNLHCQGKWSRQLSNKCKYWIKLHHLHTCPSF